MKRNVWTWRGKQKIFKADPREKLGMDEKIIILEEMLKNEEDEKKERIKKVEIESKVWKTLREERAKLKKEKMDKKRKHEKSWETVRWVLKMLQHDILNWNSIPDDSDIWKNSGLRTNSKKQRL